MKALLTSLSSISQLFCPLDNPFAHWCHSWRFCGKFQEAYSFVTNWQQRVHHLWYVPWVQHQICHRDAQKTGASRKHHQVWSTALPSQKVVLSSVKKQDTTHSYTPWWPDLGHTLPHTAERKKQAASNRGGLSTYRNQNGGNKVEAWFGAHQEGADIIIVQHNCSARCSYTPQRGIFWECQESSLQLQAILWKTFIQLPTTRLLMAERYWK